MRAYLSGQRTPGQRVRTAPTLVEPFVGYCRQRLADDPHLWASTLLDELVELGYRGSYPSLTAAIRALGLRPHCEPCHAVRGRDVAIIDHPAGEETQWDWVELPDPPAGWRGAAGSGRQAHLLVGALAHSGRWRGVLAEAEDLPHLVEAIAGVTDRLGGVTRRWRFDRMATVCSPASGRITETFAAVARHYGVGIDICPPRRGNRKGVVEKANHAAAQRWWRTLADETSRVQAQAGLDQLCARLDGRVRRRDGTRTTVGELAAGEGLRPAPRAVFPAELTVARTVTAQGLVAFRGNSYSVPPGLAGTQVSVRHRLGTDLIHIATAASAVIAAHRRAPDGAGQVVRDSGHVVALERAVLAAFTTEAACRHKTRRPPSAVARAEATRLRHLHGGLPVTDPAARVVIDMSTYAAAAARLTTTSGTRPSTATSPASAADPDEET